MGQIGKPNKITEVETPFVPNTVPEQTPAPVKQEPEKVPA